MHQKWTRGESNSSLLSGRRKAEVHRTSCAPVQKTGYAMFYPLIRLPLVHRKKGAKKLTLPHSLFPMDQRGVEPLSESPSIAVSPITAAYLTFPPLYTNRQVYSFSSFMIRPHAQSLTCVVSHIVDAWVTKCGCSESDSCH